MTIKNQFEAAPFALPADLADVALIDATTCAAAGDMSVSWWHEQVRAGHAPAPVIRKPRCTRWRISHVRSFWLAQGTAADPGVAARVVAHAKRASLKAQEPEALARAAERRKARAERREGELNA